MTETFECPNCGAPLELDGSNAPTVRCAYCGQTVIVPTALRGSTPSSDKNLAEITRLARAGNKIAAIKLYRETFGGGLKEAKDAVEHLAQGASTVEVPGADWTAPVAVTETQRAPASRPGWVVPFILLVAIGLPILCLVVTTGTFVSFGSSASTPIRVAIPTIAALPPTDIPIPTVTPTPEFASITLQFGSEGTGPGRFTDARSIATDGAGRIYVGDYTGGRIQVFDASGKYVSQWSVGGPKTILYSLAADRNGTVYAVVDEKILRYDGATVKSLGALTYSGGDRFGAVTAAPDGGLLAVWYQNRFGLITSLEGHREALVYFDREGNVTRTLPSFISNQTGDPELDVRLAVDGLGNVFALGDPFESAVFKFSPDGKFVTRFGSPGDEPGQLRSPNAIAVDGQSRVYVSDSNGIQVFDPKGRYLATFGARGSAFGMVFNDRDELLVAARNQVLKYVLTRASR